MVKLTPEQQQDFISADSAAFVPASGAWGRQGCTTVRLDSVAKDKLGEAITLAWQNTARVAAHPKTSRPGKAGKQSGSRSKRNAKGY